MEMLCGAVGLMIGVLMMRAPFNRVRDDNRKLRDALEGLVESSIEHLKATAELRRQFAEYRQRYDPIRTHTVDNVVTIERVRECQTPVE